jgi:hypothetical protein
VQSNRAEEYLSGIAENDTASMPGGVPCNAQPGWVKLHWYSRKSFRLSTAGTWFYYGVAKPPAPYQFKLSFAPSDLEKLATDNFVRIVESASDSGGEDGRSGAGRSFTDIRWGERRYSQGVSYAWTAAAEIRQTLADVLRRTLATCC